MDKLHTVSNGKMVANSYDFPVELQPIFLGNNQEIPKRKAVVRTDTMQTLGIVSNDYGLVKHAAVIDAFREAGQEYNIKEEINLVKDGAYLLYKMTFPKVQAEIRKGDLVQMQMIAKNSYNGMNSLTIVFGAFRLVCLNGMVLGRQFMQFSYRHIGNVGGMTSFDIDQYRNAYATYIKLFGERMPMITGMARQELRSTDGLFEKEYVSLPKYLLQEAKQSYETGKDNTVWGYYNALTFAITHRLKKPSPDLQVFYGMEAWKAAEKTVN